MKSSLCVPPVWLMGLSTATLGFSVGIVFFVLPQLMAAEHVPELKIAAVTAVAFSSNFWNVLFSPMLDVRFSRRWYATVLAGLAALSVVAAVLCPRHLLVLEFAMTIGAASASLSSSALGGWLANVAEHKDKNTLSKWMNIALISGGGVTSLLGGELARNFPAPAAAALLGAIVFLPTTIYRWIPAQGPDRRLAGESFSQFNREILALLRRREVVVVLLLFLSPCSAFALPQMLGALGEDFHASARAVSLAGGVGVFFPGLIGCFLFPVLAKRIPLRFLYVANGVAGSAFALCLIVLPHVTWSFGVAVFGEFLFQAVAFATQIGIVFETIGAENPLAATTFAFLTAATNVSVTYMMVADGHAYSAGGIAGALGADGAIGIAACLMAGVLLAKFDVRAPRVATKVARLAEADD